MNGTKMTNVVLTFALLTPEILKDLKVCLAIINPVLILAFLRFQDLKISKGRLYSFYLAVTRALERTKRTVEHFFSSFFVLFVV